MARLGQIGKSALVIPPTKVSKIDTDIDRFIKRTLSRDLPRKSEDPPLILNSKSYRSLERIAEAITKDRNYGGTLESERRGGYRLVLRRKLPRT